MFFHQAAESKANFVVLQFGHPPIPRQPSPVAALAPGVLPYNVPPMRVPIIMPQLGESIAEATVVNIAVKPGDSVTADQEIIEVEDQ